MSLKEIITEEIKNFSEAIEVFHGTDRNFNKFDLSKIGSGDGKSKGGWGIYFSDNEEVSKGYSTSQGWVREFKLKNGPYFDLDEPLEIGDMILKKLSTMNIPENELEEFQSDYIDYYPDITNMQAYEWLSYILGGEKQASLFLNSLGFIGNTFMDKWDREARNYVVFDLDAILK